jgi:hypothetical protein
VINADELRAGTHPGGLVTRYFAEGATSTFFGTSLALLNTDTLPSHTLLRFLRGDGTVVTHPVEVPARTRVTVNPATINGMERAEFATVVEADVAVVVDRTMTWDGRGYGAHAETSMPAPATTWYLAEGATHSGFQLFYLLQNPNAAAATVGIQYLLPSPAPPVLRTYTVGAAARFNVWVNTDPALAATDVSAVVTSDVPIIVERAMYLDRPGQPFAAGHESAGITAPATEWFLAEGATGAYFDTFVLVANPGAAAANVRADFLLPDGTVLTRSYAVAPTSRFNIWIDAEGGVLANTAVSTRITSDVPVLVERAMWWPGPTSATWTEAHNSAGVTAPGRSWALAEGEQGGPQATETYILVANTSAFAGRARVTLFFEDGTSVERLVDLQPTSRVNVAVGAPEASGGFGTVAADRRFGALIESLAIEAGGDVPQIVVERAIYSNAGGVVWAAGTNAVGTRLR